MSEGGLRRGRSELRRSARIAWMVLVWLAPGLARAQSPPLWGRLAPGPHAVGFRSTWELDPGRRYNTSLPDKSAYSSGKAPRPILINVWYPAEKNPDARPMPHGEYYDIKSDDPRLLRFADMLSNYQRNVVRKELFDKSAEEMDERERKLLDRLWSTPTACVRDAKPLDARSPVVVYHCGAQSSYEDNSVLCEFLASHGYVVIGSAFQEASGSSLNIDAFEGSSSDFAFLISYASRLPFADWEHVAVAGHSAGAQAALKYVTRGATPVDALVSLDTTQDYASLSTHGWDDLVASVTKSTRVMTMPILMAADARAVFELADSVDQSERDYFTVKELDHNEYISQGMFKRLLARWAKAEGEGDPPKVAAGSPEALYPALCEYVLAFLDARLRGDPTRQKALDDVYHGSKLGGDVPHVERVPVATKSARPFRESDGLPPEPRQMRGLIQERGVESTIAILKAAHEKSPEAPVFEGSVALSLIDALLAQGRSREASMVFQLYGGFDPEFRKQISALGRLWLKIGNKKRALETFQKAVLLAPDDRQSAEQVERLRRELQSGPL